MDYVHRAGKRLQNRWKPCLAGSLLILLGFYAVPRIEFDSSRFSTTEYGTYDSTLTPENSGESQEAIIFSLVREEEVDGMIQSITDLQNRFNNKFHYDWLFASETNFTTEFRKKIQDAFTSGTAMFEQIPKQFWQYPDFIDLEEAAKNRKSMADAGVNYGDSESYRHMCRFNSGFFYHLDALADYRYYWRVEPDVRFKCDIPEDPFQVMRDGEYVYGWTMTMPEDSKTVETLWATVKKFIHETKPSMPLDNMLDFVTDDNSRTYNMCHYWSNFEIGDLNFFRSDQYQAYFEYLDRTGGFFYERWGDAPVHSIAVSLFLPSSKIKHFPHTGYYHNPNQGCPLKKEVREELNCDCSWQEDWTFHHYSCTEKYYKVSNAPHP